MPMTDLDALSAVAIYGRVWSIDPAAADAYIAVLKSIDMAAHAADFEAASKSSEPKASSSAKSENGIARFDVEGPMTRKQTSMSSMFGGTATIPMRQQIRQARRDSDIVGAAIYFHSPGGTVEGLHDFAEEIAAFAAEKPIVAYVSDLCASAALYAASQCTAIFAGPSAYIGCIGTVTTLTDSSRAFENEGVKRHLIVNREATVKGAGTPGVPITKAMIDDIQAMVNSYSDQFVAAVAKGRKMDVDDVRAMATGQMFDAQDALSRNLIDGVMSFDDVMQSLQTGEWPAGISVSASRAGEERSMGLIEKFVSAFRGEAKTDDEVAAATALENEVQAQNAVATDAVTEAANLRAENETLKKQLADAGITTAQAAEQLMEANANAFVGSLASKIVPAEEADVKAAYIQAATDDAVAGTTARVDLLKSMYAKRPEHGLTAELLPDPAKPGATTEVVVLPNQSATGGAGTRSENEGEPGSERLIKKTMTAEQRKAVMSSTATGRKALAAQEGK